MMIYLRLLLVLLLIVSQSCTDKDFTSYKPDLMAINNIKGHIKSVNSISFGVSQKFGEIVKGEKFIPRFELLKFVPIYLPSNCEIEFTAGGEIKKEKLEFNTGLIVNLEFKTDADGNTIEVIDNITNEITKNEFENNLLVESIVYNSNGETERTTKFKYQNGLVSEIEVRNIESKEIEKSKYSYEKGLQIRQQYDNSGELWVTTKLDKIGRIQERTLYIRVHTYKYRGSSLIPFEIVKTNRKNIDKIEIELDSDQNVEEVRIFENGNIEVTFNYIYKLDQQGNWVEKLLYVDGEPNNLTERHLEYYQ